METFAIVLFFIWGLIGFVLIFIEVMATTSMTNVGVGQSMYVAMHVLWYISGTVFFGIFALLARDPMTVLGLLNKIEERLQSIDRQAREQAAERKKVPPATP